MAKMGRLETGILFVILTAIISGISIFLNKFGVAGINADIFTFAKNIIVALLLLSAILLFSQFKELKKITKKQWSKLVVIGLIGGAIPFILFFRGLKLISASNGSLIHKMMFLFVAVFAVFFLKEKLNKTFFVSAILLFAGNALLLGVYYNAFGSIGIGEIMILAATLFWAAEVVLAKKVLEEVSGTIVAFTRMFFGAIFILLFLIATGEFSMLASINSQQFGWILVTSLLLLGYVYFWYNGLKETKATIATQILLIGAPITTLLNFVFFGDAITIAQGVGIVLILMASSLVLFVEFKHKDAEIVKSY